jgi:polar amino acid transport system substrate-binding protein
MIGRMVGTVLLFFWMTGTSGAGQLMRIAHAQSFPPIVEVQDGKSVGLAIDILRAAAARADIDLLFVPVTIEQQMPSLTDGRADALYTAITPERRQVLDFGAPVLMTGGGLYVRAPNTAPDSLSALSGKVVVTPRAGPLAAFIQKTAPDVKLVVTADYEESLARIVQGDADAAALNFQAGARIAARLFPGQVTIPRNMFIQTPQAVGVLRGRDVKLVARLDSGLAAIRADGTWQQINDRWIGR